jgi:serine/threonine protein kinase
MNWTDDDRDESPTVLRYHPGQRLFDRFILDHDLASGGMGVVWLAHDERLDRRIALKFLPDRLRHDQASFDLLKREAQKSIELSHPNIVRFYDFVHDDQTAAISMEYVDGETLSAMRKAQTNKVFEAADLRNKLRQLCSALEYAHDIAEIVHRDLKPSNLMVNRRGQLKVMDFGIASSLHLGDGKSERGGGTPGFMSPQQAARQPASVLDDVYSLGATIYDLLTSRPPTYSDEKKQVVAHMPGDKLLTMTERRVAMRISGEPIPRQWEEAVMGCLAYDPAKRPQNIREVAERLALLENTTRPVLQPPEAPTGLRIRAGDRRLVLNWADVPGVTSYNVKRSTQPTGPFTLVATVTETAHADGTVQNGKTYYYVVEATNAAGDSEPSAPIQGEPQPPPPPPTGFRSKVSDQLVMLEWDPAPGVTAYIIKRSANSGGPYSTVATIQSSTRFQDAGVQNGVSYFYIVEAVSPLGLSAASVEIRATPCPPPRAPVGLSLTAGDAGVEVRWKAVDDAVAYRVLRGEHPGGPYAHVGTLEDKTVFHDKHLHNGRVYFYVVESLNAAGISPQSHEVSGTPQPVPLPPRGVRIEAGDGQALLTWAGSSYATGYTVNRSETSGGPYEQVAVVNTGTSFLDAPLAKGRTYYYTVGAFNGSGSSALAEEVGTRRSGALGRAGAGLLKKLAWGAATLVVAALLVVVVMFAGKLRPAVKQGLKVETSPPGATVIIDEKIIGRTTRPLEKILSPGTYTARIELEGYDTTNVTFTVRLDELYEVPLIELKRSKGAISLRTDPPEAFQYVLKGTEGDPLFGAVTNQSATLTLPTGSYTVEIRKPGWEPHLETVQVRKDTAANVVARFQPVSLLITSEPLKADVYREFVRLGATPLQTNLPPGKYEFVLKYPGLADARQSVTLTREGTNQLPVRFDYGLVLIESEPSDAEVLDAETGASLGRTPWRSGYLPGGTRSYHVRKSGYDSKTVAISGSTGTPPPTTVILERYREPRGSLIVRCEQGDARVFLDGTLAGRVNEEIRDLKTGAHKVEVRLDGFESQDVGAQVVRANDVTTVSSIRLEPSRGTLEISSSPADLPFVVRTASGRPVTNYAGLARLALTTGVYRVVFTKSFLNGAITSNDTHEVTLARNETKKVEGRIGVTEVEITSDPPGTPIYWLERQVAATTPARVELPLGSHYLEARHSWLGRKTVQVESRRAEFAFDYGSVRVESAPSGADVFLVDAAGRPLGQGVTPFTTNFVPPGVARYRVAMTGYKPRDLQGTVSKGSELALKAELLPATGNLLVTTDPPGAVVLVGSEQVNAWPKTGLKVGQLSVKATKENYEPYQASVDIEEDKTATLPIKLARSTGAVQVTSLPEGIDFTLEGPELPQPRTGKTPRTVAGLPTGEYRLTVSQGQWKEGPVSVTVARNQTNRPVQPLRLPYGSVRVETEPAGAAVAVNGQPLTTGRTNTPLVLAQVGEGALDLAFALKGYRAMTLTTNITRQSETLVRAKLLPALGPQPGGRWTNSLEMVFVPMPGTPHHIAIIETRRRDFDRFVSRASYRESEKWRQPGFDQGDSHPVINVNWRDANEFCKWLTRHERESSGTPHQLDTQFYRLPTDAEWSAVADNGALFTWGGDWPPPVMAGNFHNSLSFDLFERTAPVGLFLPNRLGIYDLAGNVWEWCDGRPLSTQPVVRGGSWLDSSPRILQVKVSRNTPPAEERSFNVGFRCVIDAGTTGSGATASLP